MTSARFRQRKTNGASPKITRDSPPSVEDSHLTVFADGFTRPLYATHAGDGSGRLFVVEQSGKIWIIKDGHRRSEPFLDISHLLSPASLSDDPDEEGLLSLAFHPDFATNGKLYVYYTEFFASDTVLASYQVRETNPNIVDETSAEILLYVWQPEIKHNGGHLAFGPDGFLYVSLGDGGTLRDTLGAGQNRKLILGSILRIDVDNGHPYALPADNPFVGDPKAEGEIWAYGLRNPWRFSFDRLTGDMYIGDVGEMSWEEVNFQPADSKGGENYGWNVYEGNHLFAGGEAPNYAPPFFVYGHAHGCTVTGGYVYRGEAIPSLQATYLFADFCSGRIWAAWRNSDLRWGLIELMKLDMRISSFGEDEAGELYIIDYRGAVYRFDPA